MNVNGTMLREKSLFQQFNFDKCDELQTPAVFLGHCQSGRCHARGRTTAHHTANPVRADQAAGRMDGAQAIQKSRAQPGAHRRRPLGAGLRRPDLCLGRGAGNCRSRGARQEKGAGLQGRGGRLGNQVNCLPAAGAGPGHWRAGAPDLQRGQVPGPAGATGLEPPGPGDCRRTHVAPPERARL